MNLKPLFNYSKIFRNIAKIIIVILILILISKELFSHTTEIKTYITTFDLSFFLFSIMFCAMSQLSGSYVFFLIFKLVSKINLLYHFRLSINGQFLDYFPFIGVLYKAKNLKKKFKIGYTNFLSSYFLSLSFRLINLLFLLTLIFFIFYNKNLIININIYFITTFLFFLSLFLIFFSSRIYMWIKKINLKTIIINKKIDLNKFINLFAEIHIKLLKNKFQFFKCLFFDLLSNIFYFFSFYFIFETYEINFELFSLIIIYLLFSLVTLVKILPKNIFVDEFVGSYLIALGFDSFVLGIIIMLTLRVINLISILFLFIIANIKNFF